MLGLRRLMRSSQFASATGTSQDFIERHGVYHRNWLSDGSLLTWGTHHIEAHLPLRKGYDIGLLRRRSSGLPNQQRQTSINIRNLPEQFRKVFRVGFSGP